MSKRKSWTYLLHWIGSLQNLYPSAFPRWLGFFPTSYATACFEPKSVRVTPDWDLWRTLNWLSYRAAARSIQNLRCAVVLKHALVSKCIRQMVGFCSYLLCCGVFWAQVSQSYIWLGPLKDALLTELPRCSSVLQNLRCAAVQIAKLKVNRNRERECSCIQRTTLLSPFSLKLVTVALSWNSKSSNWLF